MHPHEIQSRSQFPSFESKLVEKKKKKRKKKKMNSTLSKEKREGGSCFFPPFFPPFTVLNIELKSQDRDDDPVTERCSGLDDANGILCSERNSFQISLWGIETSPPGTESFFHFLSSASERLLPPSPSLFKPNSRARASLFLRDGTSHHRRLLGQISISDSSFARKISRDNAFNVSRDVLSRDQTLSSRKQGRDPKGFLLLTDPPSRYTLEPPFPLPSPQMAPPSPFCSFAKTSFLGFHFERGSLWLFPSTRLCGKVEWSNLLADRFDSLNIVKLSRWSILRFEFIHKVREIVVRTNSRLFLRSIFFPFFKNSIFRINTQRCDKIRFGWKVNFPSNLSGI